MAVFNALEYDGRVQRAAEALSGMSRVVVLGVDGGHRYSPTDYQYVSLQDKRGQFGRSKAMHLRFFIRLIALVLEIRPSIVYAHDFFMAFPGWCAAKLVGARYVYDAHELIVPEKYTAMSKKERVWYWLERLIVRRADLVIAANTPRAKAMADHYKLPTVPLAIRNITPAPAVRLDNAAIVLRYPALVRRSPEECLCVYQGDINLERGLGVMVAAMSYLSSNYRLLVIGGGPDVAAMMMLADQQHCADKVNILGKVPRDDLHDMLRFCDIGVITYSFHGLNNVFCAPNKVFEYAFAGIPIVSTGQPPLLELVADTGIGRTTASGRAPSASELAAAIEDVREHASQCKSALKSFLEANNWINEAALLREAMLKLPQISWGNR
jgi:glycosyltransferase involved in cell wall biosynthesis